MTERGVIWTKFPKSSEVDFLALRIVTFLNWMEFKGRVDGEIGDLFEKIEKKLSREGSLKAGASLGLVGKLMTGELVVSGIRGGAAEEEGREG